MYARAALTIVSRPVEDQCWHCHECEFGQEYIPGSLLGDLSLKMGSNKIASKTVDR